MPPLEFPRTMTKGLLKGQRFDSQREYMEALAVAQRSKKVEDEHRFELTVVDGKMTVRITGDPRSTKDIDRLLELLSQYGGR